MTSARKDVNEAIARFSLLFEEGSVLFVGVDSKWNYRDIFESKGIEYVTMDINPAKEPDIVGDIQGCELENSSFDGIIMTGVYEFLSNPTSAMEEIKRLLKDGGKALVCVPGEGYQTQGTKVNLEEIFDVLSPLEVTDLHVTYYRGIPSYIEALCI
jgi:SAM-dependent methyltransferase